MAEQRSARNVAEPAEPLLEALIELARVAITARREVAERRGKMTVVQGGRRGRAA